MRRVVAVLLQLRDTELRRSRRRRPACHLRGAPPRSRRPRRIGTAARRSRSPSFPRDRRRVVCRGARYGGFELALDRVGNRLRSASPCSSSTITSPLGSVDELDISRDSRCIAVADTSQARWRGRHVAGPRDPCVAPAAARRSEGRLAQQRRERLVVRGRRMLRARRTSTRSPSSRSRARTRSRPLERRTVPNTCWPSTEHAVLAVSCGRARRRRHARQRDHLDPRACTAHRSSRRRAAGPVRRLQLPLDGVREPLQRAVRPSSTRSDRRGARRTSPRRPRCRRTTVGDGRIPLARRAACRGRRPRRHGARRRRRLERARLRARAARAATPSVRTGSNVRRGASASSACVSILRFVALRSRSSLTWRSSFSESWSIDAFMSRVASRARSVWPFSQTVASAT